MKKFLVLFLGFLTLTLGACKKNNDSSQIQNGPTSYDNLPSQAQQFITQHFPTASIVSVVIDEGRYEVWLNNGTEIEFTMQGEWKEVDCHMTQVPNSIIPAKILEYVTAHYPNNFIVKIEKDYDGYDIELNNGLDLDFDYNGNLQEVSFK